MSKKYHWEYAGASYMQVGQMICTACQKPITTGEYRYRETEDAYLPQHRACSPQDKMWARMDAKAKRAAEYEAARRAAFREFVEKWGLPGDLVETWSES